MPTTRPAAVCRRLHCSNTRRRTRYLTAVAWGVLALLLDGRSALAGPSAPEEPVGRPLIHNYNRRDFGGEVQQWDVVQDARGIMYFANNAGVLEFDGRNWRLIELPSRVAVRALAWDAAGGLHPNAQTPRVGDPGLHPNAQTPRVGDPGLHPNAQTPRVGDPGLHPNAQTPRVGDPGGRIYVGAAGDFGYLGPDAAGQLQFVSLMPQESRHDRSFDQVFTPVVVPRAVYFQARTKWCRLAGGQVRCRETDPALSRMFVAGRQVYVQQLGVGLMEMVDEVPRLVPGGERFAHEEVRVVLPHAGEHGEILVGLRSSELFLQRGRSFEPFAPAVYDRRLDERLAAGAVLPNGSFAFGTQRRGLLIVDRQGRLLHQIDRSAGLQDNFVHAVLADRQGGLWLALQTGASRVEVASPFSVFDEASGLEQEWRAVIRHGESLYVRGYSGLFEATLPTASSAQPPAARTLRFRRVPGIDAHVWSMLPIGDRLLVSSASGIDEIRAKRRRRLVSYQSMPMALYRSRTDPQRVYVGLVQGLASLYLAGDSWRDEGRLTGIDETITSIGETRSGSLWLVSQRQRVIRVDFAAAADDAVRPDERSPRIRHYPPGSDALTGRIAIQQIGGRPVFLTDKRIVEFDEATGTFVPVPGLTVLSEAGRRSFSYVTEDRHGNIWVASRRPGAIDFLRKQLDGSYRVDNGGLRQVLVWSVYPEEHSDVVWLCTPDYLLRYDPSRRAPSSRGFTTLIRKVTTDDDRVVYGGAPMLETAGRDTSDHGPAFAYGARSLQFEFAATAFDAPEMNEYQSRLEGFDREWSAWSRTPSRVYANLSPGRYRFAARARDVHGQISRESIYAFTVLPPWYHSAWVYALYGLAGVGLILVIRRIELRRSHAKLRRQVESMELEKLRELDALKSRFFADISHELRTPLTLILGPVRQILDDSSKPQVVQKLQLVRRNAEYLLRLISQILDLSKLEARGMRLRAAAGDLVQCVRTSVASFATAAEDQNIDLRFEAASQDPPTGSDRDADPYFDRDVVEKIINNLVGNALKFTSSGGAVSVSLVTGTDAAEIRVADTGIGIARDRLPHIFDRFYQIEGTRSREGIGVGLALVKELVELHHGTIAVESVEGKGTTFVIRLPTGTAHLEPDEIVPAIPVKAIEPSKVTLAPERAEPAALGHAAGHAVVHAGGHAAAHAAASESDEDTAVLVVEDHTGVRHFVREQLQPYYRVIEAENGSAGFDLAVSSLPDLVLSDVMMPGLNGYDLCRALKHDNRTCHIPVVLLTARAGRDDKLLGLDTGADSYLVKPFDSSELLVQVRNLIEQRRLLRERFSAPVILKPSEMGVVPMDEAFLQKVLTVVQDNLADPDFDVVMLGREVGLSRSQLHRKLRALTNQSPTLLIRSIRLQRAAELLRQKGGSVAEIAYRVGFSSQTYFAKCFREELGCSPKEYARNGKAATTSATVAKISSHVAT